MGQACCTPVCMTPGCGKPTFNGKPGEYCSMACKIKSSGEVCLTPGCGKPTYNGKPGEYCSMACKNKSSGAVCLTPGCGKPTYNGKPGEYCSKACKGNAVAVCLTPGCGKPTYNGKPGEYCSKACKANAVAVCLTPGGGKPTASCKLLQQGDSEFQDVKNQYLKKWDKNRGPPTPIREIYKVEASAAQQKAFEDACNKIGNVKAFGYDTSPGNVQRRFHGTSLKCNFQGSLCSNPACGTCSIIQNGFDMGKNGSWSGNSGMYGGGIYFTSMSSTAKGYGLCTCNGYTFLAGNWMHAAAGNSVLLAFVACGRVENVKENDTPGQLDLSQYHARKVDKGSGADELVIFCNNQACVGFVIVF